MEAACRARESSTFPSGAGRALIRRTGFTLILGNLASLSSLSRARSASRVVVVARRSARRVATALATSLKHDSSRRRHFNEAEAAAEVPRQCHYREKGAVEGVAKEVGG